MPWVLLTMVPRNRVPRSSIGFRHVTEGKARYEALAVCSILAVHLEMRRSKQKQDGNERAYQTSTRKRNTSAKLHHRKKCSM